MPADKDPWSFTEDDLAIEDVPEEDDEEEEIEGKIPSRPKAHTVVGPETFLRGHLNARRAVQVEGGYRGTIECQDAIIVGPTGRAEGEVIANLVIVEGRFKGNITPRRCLMIEGEGLFIGDLTCQPEVLVLSENAQFSGEAATQGLKAPPTSDVEADQNDND